MLSVWSDASYKVEARSHSHGLINSLQDKQRNQTAPTTWTVNVYK